MSFKNSQPYQELRADWRWIHSMDADAAAAADRWVREHPEEWKELERVLYYSEANFHKRVALNELEEAEMRQPHTYDPEAFLPEEVRNAIYNDMRWFDRAKYLPEGSEEDPFLYVSRELDEGLHELTELQREILFRTVINGESTESVAHDKQCTARNIRDIRARALRRLRQKLTKHEGSGKPSIFTVVMLLIVLACIPLIRWIDQLVVTYPWLEHAGCAIVVPVIILLFYRSRNREVEGLLRNHWVSLNGSQRKE